MKKIKIPVPPFAVQKNISKVIKKMKEESTTLNNSAEQLRNQAKIQLQNQIFSNK